MYHVRGNSFGYGVRYLVPSVTIPIIYRCVGVSHVGVGTSLRPRQMSTTVGWSLSYSPPMEGDMYVNCKIICQ